MIGVEKFECSYDEIASMVGSSTANCRQLFHRAKERLAAGRPFRGPGLPRPGPGDAGAYPARPRLKVTVTVITTGTGTPRSSVGV
jgi:hypothetical protein